MDTPLRILVAEDDLGDVLLLKRAFEAAKVKPPIYFAGDGQEVLDYLCGRPPFQNPIRCPLPNVLILDLKLPRVDGFEVLEWLREHTVFRHMLVVVLTGSELPGDIDRAYALGANAYIVKPAEPELLVDIVARLQSYWKSINSDPNEPALVPSLASL